MFTTTEATWESKLQNGLYQVTVSVGDCQFPQGPHRVIVEGDTIIGGTGAEARTKPGTQAFIVRSWWATVLDGRLTVTIGGGGGITTLNYIDVAPALGPRPTLIAINWDYKVKYLAVEPEEQKAKKRAISRVIERVLSPSRQGP